MKRATRHVLGVAFTSILALAGCNSILDNQPPVLVEDDGGTALPAPTGSSTDTPPPPPAPSSTDTTPPPPVPPPVDAGPAGCPTGTTLCNGLCVSNDDPLYGCGSPTCKPCSLTHATARCNAGACAVNACDHGWSDCNANATDGCETDNSKAATCGGCNQPCPAASPYCIANGPSYACTNGCSAAAPLLCGTDCVNPLTSTAHCGGCAVKCPDVANATTMCNDGVCGFTCQTGFHSCTTKCAADTDPKACGAACTACPTPPHATANCTADACAFTCDPNFADCDKNAANGCEANLGTDNANCGACGVKCAAGTTCKPAAAPATGFACAP